MEATDNPRSATAPGDAALRGGSEMGAHMRAFDWGHLNRRTGRVPAAEPSDRASILLDSQYPMYIAWGPESIEFYNDAFRPHSGIG